ncbi:hypothetical protein VTL71DRAFT_12203 [Oculimacula yallundae]|uniref:MYND-type domain-containing protein n=1 Tax=Oculimacula yallundae TaxID=86028 RepID=A0ABR4CSD5_9HELO
MPASSFVTFPKPVLAAKGAICTTCLQKAEAPAKLNKCGGCKRTSYCSKKCQKKDWTDGHKRDCKIFIEVDGAFSDEKQPQNWEDYRLQVWRKVNAFRALCKQSKVTASNTERSLLYQPYCAKCYLSQQPETNKLIFCTTCQIASYCTLCSPSSASHTHSCPTLHRIATAETFSISHYLSTGQTSLGMPTSIPRSTYRPLSSISTWIDYFTLLSDKSSLVSGKVTPDLKPLGTGNEQISNALIAASDKNTMMLTILAALEVVFQDDLATKDSLTLHILGATATELDALMLFEELLHLLPNLKTLHCVFIGPQLPNPLYGDERVVLDCCPVCTNQTRKRSMSMFQGTYHEYIASHPFTQEHNSTPDLAVAFHSGHSQEAQLEWEPTIKLLAEARFPTLFTTYNEKEMREETEGLARMGAGFSKEGERNQWMGMRMLLDPLEESEGSVYANNMFWYVVQGRRG